MNDNKEALIDKDWLSVENYQFKILVMIAVLAQNNLAYRGKLKDMCEFLGVGTSQKNRDKIKEAINALVESKDILVIKEGQTWTLTLSTKAERKPKVVSIRKCWVKLIQAYEAPAEDAVSWENVLKVLVYLIADKKEVKTYKEIADELGIAAKTIERAIKALDGIDFGDISIKRKIAWFKNKKNEFKVKGQHIEVGFDFTAEP